MTPLLRSVAISAAANAVSLAFAAFLFDSFNIRFGWFVVAVGLFTVLTVVLRGIVVGTVNRFVRGYTIFGGLVLTLVGLLVTDAAVPASGFSIEGTWTWVGVVLMVWAAGVAFGEVDSTRPEPR
ncbi:MAG: hypothetical protein JWQ91_1059 [Aeromicrobium sp.]|jgi:hypothetical protein|uniref:hypothetical protein n=1 Tax=Aeromicrobium sp. TaxID=1871063 RepID=UPI00262D7635|nr:hypothetical protein [Aeromicrobium sp.]MCW2788570.1 hypothetical protein [Aeromicrobium sp.]MCW2824142.1 hypothetical protein [Aeromicrobium sp.]